MDRRLVYYLMMLPSLVIGILSLLFPISWFQIPISLVLLIGSFVAYDHMEKRGRLIPVRIKRNRK